MVRALDGIVGAIEWVRIHPAAAGITGGDLNGLDIRREWSLAEVGVPTTPIDRA